MTYGKVKGTEMRTIDLTPSWETAVRIYIMVLEDGDGPRGANALGSQL
jgi:hypothetical protein